jgi:type 1 glutamine amidotransferase
MALRTIPSARTIRQAPLAWFATVSVMLSVMLHAVAADDSVSKRNAPTKIVLVYTVPDHPYGSHMYEHECNLLAHCLKQTKGVDAIVVKDWPDESQLKDVNAIVFYSRPAGDIVLLSEHRKQFGELMNNGVGFAAIHWATGAEKERGNDYGKLLGGWFNFAHAGLKVDKRTLEQQDSKHPICRGWQPYDLREEFYLNLKFDERARPVLKANVDGKDQIVAWVLERPDSKNGRSFGTTLGHFHDNFVVENFRKAIVNGILWVAHVDVPEKGAPVDVTDKRTNLPPQS